MFACMHSIHACLVSTIYIYIYIYIYRYVCMHLMKNIVYIVNIYIYIDIHILRFYIRVYMLTIFGPCNFSTEFTSCRYSCLFTSTTIFTTCYFFQPLVSPPNMVAPSGLKSLWIALDETKGPHITDEQSLWVIFSQKRKTNFLQGQ